MKDNHVYGKVDEKDKDLNPNVTTPHIQITIHPLKGFVVKRQEAQQRYKWYLPPHFY